MKDIDSPFPNIPDLQSIRKSWLFKRALQILGVKSEQKIDIGDQDFDIGRLQLNDNETDNITDDDHGRPNGEVVKKCSVPTGFPVKNGIIFKAPTRIYTVKVYCGFKYKCILQYHPRLSDQDDGSDVEPDTPSDDIYTCMSNLKTFDLGLHRQTNNNIDDQNKLQSEIHPTPIVSQLLVDDDILRQILPLKYHEFISTFGYDDEEKIFVYVETVPHGETVSYGEDIKSCRTCIMRAFGDDITTKSIDSESIRGLKSIVPLTAYYSLDNPEYIARLDVREFEFNINTIGCVRVFHNGKFLQDIQFFKRIETFDMPIIPQLPMSTIDVNHSISTETDLCFYKPSEHNEDDGPISIRYTDYDDFMIEPYDSIKGFNISFKDYLIGIQIVTTKGRKSKIIGGDGGWLGYLTPPEGYTIVGVQAVLIQNEDKKSENGLDDFGIIYAKI